MFLTGTVAAAVLAMCAGARWYLDRSSRRDTAHFGGRVRLRTLWNRGGGFGLPWRGRPLALASLAALAAAWGAALGSRRRLPRLGAGLLLGGGGSNLYERLRHGRVYDYVQFPKLPGRAGRLVFNLADFAILAGALLLLGRNRKHDRGRGA